MKKAVIFDFDGVIINSHEVQKNALKIAYRDICGAGEVPYEEFFKLSGDSLENIFTKLGLPLEMVAKYREYSSSHIHCIEFNHGFIDIFEYLKINNIKCILCTGKERKRTMQTLKYFEIDHYFSMVICSDDVKNPKPNPESIEIVKSTYDLNSEQLILIGDGINDVRCARNACIKSIAVSWGDVAREDLKKEKPNVLVDSIEEILSILKQWIIA